MKPAWSVSVILACVCVRCDASLKQGIPFGPKHFLCDDFKAFGNITWWYNWSLTNFSRFTNCTGLDSYAASHVPMVWGPKATHNLDLVPRNAQAVLGFNEPNHKEQSAIQPEVAASLWRLIEQSVPPGIPLVSPSASGCGGGGTRCLGNATQWFDAFFDACRGCRVDYLATHVYHCNAGHVMDTLRELYERYGRRKIWLTEFACPDTDDVDKEIRFMKDILPMLEEADFIYRYSWYDSRIVSPSGFVTSAASLLKQNSSELSDLGRVYVSFRNGGRETLRERLVHKMDALMNRLYALFSALYQRLRIQ